MLFNLKEYRFYICPGPFDMRAGVWRLVEHMDNRKLDVQTGLHTWYAVRAGSASRLFSGTMVTGCCRNI